MGTLRKTVGKNKNPNGRARRGAPETTDGALQSFTRTRLKYLCFECQTVKPISGVDAVIETGNRETAYTVRLSCGHVRDLVIGLPPKRTPDPTTVFVEDVEEEVTDDCELVGNVHSDFERTIDDYERAPGWAA